MRGEDQVEAAVLGDLVDGLEPPSRPGGEARVEMRIVDDGWASVGEGALRVRVQRLDHVEQAFQEQHDMLEAMQSAMQGLSAQAQAAAKLNRIFGGGLIGAAVIIIVLLGFLAL